jgi:uncharacterized protein YndB with AHSA1/START domain
LPPASPPRARLLPGPADRIAAPMGPVIVSTSIDAPRERVYELLADLANRPAFCDHFAKEYHLQRLQSYGVGASARFRADAPRFPIWMETAIVEEEAPHRLVERGYGSRADRMELGLAWELVEGPDATTKVTLTFWTEPDNPVDAALSRLGSERWYRRQWRTALRRLRELAESGEPIEPVRVGGMARL